jgi:hypothetical protein
MPVPNLEKIVCAVAQRLAHIPDSELLPMPHSHRSTKISFEEREEYRQRKERYQQVFPKYEEGFGRPSTATVDAVWTFLPPQLSQQEVFQALNSEERQAFPIILDTFISAAGGNISYNRLFDVIGRKYSDYYRKSRATTVRDMRKDTVRKIRRDLMLNNINVNTLWDVVIHWSTDLNENPLFRLEKSPYNGKGIYYRVLLKDPAIRDRFLRIMRADCQYDGVQHTGMQLWIADEQRLLSHRHTHRMCAEIPYNCVELGPRSKKLLRLQSDVVLLFDVDAFKLDYETALNNEETQADDLHKTYGINARMPNTIRQKNHKSRKIVSPRGIHVARQIRALNLGEEEKENIPKALDSYDEARSLVQNYKHVYEQVKDRQGYVQIRCEFYRLINRRYQPMHVWPTFVTARTTEEQPIHAPESTLESYRQRWFKACDPAGNPCRLIGWDISSSQTQIVATLLGIEKLEKLAMRWRDETVENKPFKEVMAEWAWEKHQDSDDPFRLRGDRGKISAYTGPEDKRLQELCKQLWMRVSYGGNIGAAVEETDKSINAPKFGPGWTEKNAARFLAYLYTRFPEMQTFLETCKHVATIAYKQNPCAGVIFTDPSDGISVRWNPVARTEDTLSNDGHKLFLALPSEYPEDSVQREYPVDPQRLRNMIAPCLVHILDAYYSTLVMEQLAERGLTTFVGIHDCWLVPETVRVNGVLVRGEEVLSQVMTQVAGQWYAGLGSIYEELLDYLSQGEKAEVKPYIDCIRAAPKKWQARVAVNYEPAFLAKKSVKSMDPV